MTFLGHHALGELRDWLAAIDYEAGQIGSAYAAFAPTWQAQDPVAHRAWLGDWQSLQSRYGVARAKAQSAIGHARWEVGVPDSMIPVEDEWQGVLHALSKTPGATGTGDFQDLYNRLTAAQGRPVDMSKLPQPTAADADLTAYKAADTVIRAGEAVARQITPSKGTGTLVVVGLGLVLGVLLATKSVLR
jgi:hypothetical protein